MTNQTPDLCDDRSLWEGFDYSQYTYSNDTRDVRDGDLDSTGWPVQKQTADQIVQGPLRISWVELGEGESGDYQEDDPNDVEYLRFDVEIYADGYWNVIPDTSYNTQFPASATNEQRQAGLILLMNRIYSDAMGGRSLKKITAELSWICLEWLQGTPRDAATAE